MSSSDAAKTEKVYTGKVLLGGGAANGMDEMSIQDLEGKKKPIWDKSTDDEYFRRVKERAQAMAKGLLAEAIKEAEILKERARQEGFEQGVAQAQAEIAAQMQAFGEHFSALLLDIRSKAATVWRSQRQDFVQVIRMAVEKTIRAEMGERRREILDSLLEQALERLTSQRRLTVKVSPQDQELVAELLRAGQEAYPDLKNWKVKPDQALAAGGVIIEADEGMVNNSLGSRWEGVEAILDDLSRETAGE